jgi:hypothetical protein
MNGTLWAIHVPRPLRYHIPKPSPQKTIGGRLDYVYTNLIGQHVAGQCLRGFHMVNEYWIVSTPGAGSRENAFNIQRSFTDQTEMKNHILAMEAQGWKQNFISFRKECAITGRSLLPSDNQAA